MLLKLSTGIFRQEKYFFKDEAGRNNGSNMNMSESTG
jgi:hypothetical protein